jgi:hypothetical protein
MVVNEGMISGRKRSWPKLRYYPGICLEGLRKTTKTSVRIAGLRVKIWTRDLPSVNHPTTTFGRLHAILVKVFYDNAGSARVHVHSAHIWNEVDYRLYTTLSKTVHQWTAKQFWVDRQSFKQQDYIYCLEKVQINKLNAYLQFKLNDVCYTHESCFYIFPVIKLNWHNFLAITYYCVIFISVLL